MSAFDWAETVRDFARQCGYTPRDVLEGMTFGQFFAVWCKAPNRVAGLDMGAVRAKINRRRRELGMPEMKPATR